VAPTLTIRTRWTAAFCLALFLVGIGIGAASTGTTIKTRTLTDVIKSYNKPGVVAVTRYRTRIQIVKGGLTTVFGDGRHWVGTKAPRPCPAPTEARACLIAPGSYYASGGRGCYWDRSDGTDHYGYGEPEQVVVYVGQFFFTSGCGTWHRR
jgi:hypothetical protein